MDFYGYTALHAAAENGRLEMIQPLLGEVDRVQASIRKYEQLKYV